MPKIKILLTGGTFGSQVSGGAAGTAERPPVLPDDGRADFEIETVMNVLSENMSLYHRKEIGDRIRGLDHAAYDGVIVTHGSDTLAYTAAYLSFMCRHIALPILLVCADRPLSDARSNGLINFSAAADFILSAGRRGVYVPFAKDGEVKIHPGLSLFQARPFFHDFISLEGAEEAPLPLKRPIPAFAEMEEVFYIAPYPGLDYNAIRFIKKPRAVLHGLYHSGTACTEGEGSSVLPFIKRCVEDGIDFYAAPSDPGGVRYRTAEEMAGLGVRFMENITAEAAYIKLVIAYSAFGGADERGAFIREG